VTAPESFQPASLLFADAVKVSNGRLKVQLDRHLLRAELDLIAEVIEPKNSLAAVVNHLLLEATDHRLILKACGLKQSWQSEIAADVLEEGSVCLPARKLCEIARQLPAETVSLGSDQGTVTLKCGSSRFRLNALPPDDFPELPAEAQFITAVPGEVLLTMIRTAIFSAQKNSSAGRYALEGAQLTIGPDGIRLIATDGFRLISLQRSDVTRDEEIALLIPRHSLSTVVRVFNQINNEIRIGLDGSHLFFQQGAQQLSCLMLEGQFPDCASILIQEFPRELALDGAAFREAINRMSVFGIDGGHHNFGLIKFRFAPDSYELQSVDTSGSEGREEITPLSTSATTETTISFNGRYLQDFARTLTSASLTIKYTDENSCVEFRPASDDGCLTRYILMPCRDPGSDHC